MSLTDNTNKVIKSVCLLISVTTAGIRITKSLSKAYFSHFQLKKKKSPFVVLNFVCHPGFPFVTHWALLSTINNNHSVQSC